MSFLVPVLAAIGGGSAAAGALTAAGTAASAYSAIKSANAAGKAVDAAGKPITQIDPSALNQQAQGIAQSNAAASQALQDQYNPGATQLQGNSLQQLLQMLQANSQPAQGSGSIQDSINAVKNTLGTNNGALNNELLNHAATTAQQQLDLGGQLPLDVRNLVARNAAAKAGSFSGPGGNLGQGRDISARDLGLTSLDLINQRLQNANTIGNSQASLGEFNANNFLGLINTLSGLGNTQFNQQQQQFGNAFNAAQFGQSIQAPNVGLDPGSVANIAIANNNAANGQQANIANIQGQQGQNYGNLAGNLFGGLLAYNARPTTPSPQSSLPTSGHGSYNQPYMMPVYNVGK